MSDGYGPPPIPEPRMQGRFNGWKVATTISTITAVLLAVVLSLNAVDTPVATPSTVPVSTDTNPMASAGVTDEQWNESYSNNARRMEDALDKATGVSIDASKCEFVLTPKRDDAFLKCPAPEDMTIPDWPTKQAPLNKE